MEAFESKKEILDCKHIQENLEPLILFYINKTHREYTPKYSAQSRSLFHLLLQVTQNLYKSIVYLCAEKPEDPFRKQSYILASIPLVRVLMEIVFSMSFISEDVEKRVAWYHKSGWREMKEIYNRCSKRYSDDETHSKWLEDFSKYLSETKSAYSISEQEENNIISIDYWPIPNKMKKQVADPLANYYQYLEDWFYKEFSQASHLSLPGLTNMGSIFLKDKVEDNIEYFAHKRTDYYICTVIMVLSILTEFENIVHYGKKDKLSFLWTFINGYSEDCKDLYKQRYMNLLSV